MTDLTGRVPSLTAGDPCPGCMPVGYLRLDCGGLSCSNCLWNSEEDSGRVSSPPGVCEVLMHDVLRPEFEKWLNARGLVLQRTPFLDSDPELPTYNVAPGPALMTAPARGSSEH